MSAKILVADDELRLAQTIALALKRRGYSCTCVSDGKQALEALEKEHFDALLSDWRMPNIDGLELLQRVRKIYPQLPVVLMTAFADISSAVSAMKEGAFDFVPKPFDNQALASILERALEFRRLRTQNENLLEQLSSDSLSYIAESPAMKASIKLAERVASAPSAVLIGGDSGTGKELIAKLIHRYSPRVTQPFVAVNCRAYSQGLLESELFGHEKGAFTGAHQARKGCFERAHGGTLFLDEIGDINLDFQAKLLRVLQEGEVTRVGGDQVHAVDVRIVAATHRNLKEAVEKGDFREDLYFRLRVIPIHLAPLKERKEDILPLANYFLERNAREQGQAKQLSQASQDHLLTHPWPGNVRELENAIERAFVLAISESIEPEDLLLETASKPEGVSLSLQQFLDQQTGEYIQQVLQKTAGRKAEAAALLGVERTTLYRLMKKLDL